MTKFVTRSILCPEGHNLKSIYYNLYTDKIKHSYHTIKNRKYCKECDKIYKVEITEVK
jgi:hypothetical protein